MHRAAAAAGGDEVERHDGGRYEAGREIGSVGGQKEGALLGRVPRGGGGGAGRSSSAVGQRADVLRRCPA